MISVINTKTSEIKTSGMKPSNSFQNHKMALTMKKHEFKLCSAFVILALFFILACAKTPHIVGKWKEIGKTATLEFWKDGTFKATDNQGMAVKGKYRLIEPGNVRFEIFRQGSPPEIVNGTVSLQGDVLTFTSADANEIESYKREK
jgi:hypothetical protein